TVTLLKTVVPVATCLPPRSRECGGHFTGSPRRRTRGCESRAVRRSRLGVRSVSPEHRMAETVDTERTRNRERRTARDSHPRDRRDAEHEDANPAQCGVLDWASARCPRFPPCGAPGYALPESFDRDPQRWPVPRMWWRSLPCVRLCIVSAVP